MEKICDLLSSLKNKIPEHVAIIMDGNRRFAKRNKLKTLLGHNEGAKNVDRIIKAAISIGVKYLTLYAFSTENWGRPTVEVNALIRLFDRYLKEKKCKFIDQKISFNVIGDISKFPSSLQKNIKDVIAATYKNKKMHLTLAVNYGGRDEIVRAVHKLIKDYDKNKLLLKDLNENLFMKYLDTSLYPDPDLLIRTGGEMRISNFLIWQSSYSEIFVTKKCWPEFSEEDFLNAIVDFQKRERRFGKDG